MTKFGGLVAFFTCLCFDASVNAGQCGQGVRGMVGGEDVDQTTNSECFNLSFVCVRAELEVTYQGQNGTSRLQCALILRPTLCKIVSIQAYFYFIF